MNRSLCAASFVLVLMACGASEEEAAEPAATSAESTEVTEATGETDEATDPASFGDDWEPPPYDYEELPPEEHDQVCGHTAHRPSDHECSEDSDCRICHDGSNCGTPVNLEELRRRGAGCQQEDAAECEYAAVRCCEGRCRVVSH